MKDYKGIMDCVDHHHVADEVWKEVAEDTHEFIEEVRMSHPDRVHHFLKKIEDALLFPPFTEERANEIVAKMANKDGTRGAHWSMAQVRDLSKNHTNLREFNCVEFFVALNMVYSDFYCSKFTTEDYIQMAVDFLGDKDAPKNKIRRYFKVME